MSGYPPERLLPFALHTPAGLRYQSEFITSDDESRLAAEIAALRFSTFEMRGVAARRKVVFFGYSYELGAPATPLPPFLMPLRQAVGLWAGVDPQAFHMALINEYPPGAPIGWHRDAPQYGVVAGVSLLSSCPMKFRPYMPNSERAAARPRRTATHQILLEPRSAYFLSGASRDKYEHHIPAVRSLRYSITFRTLRG